MRQPGAIDPALAIVPNSKKINPREREFRQSPARAYRRENVMRAHILLPLFACFVSLAPLSAAAQDYPNKAIKVIVPNPPGGAGDITARLIGQKLSDVFHQPVVVENQPGASGSIGMTMLKRAPADGYTIGVVISLAQTIDRIQNKTASFDIAKDFTPITAIANNPAGLLVNDQVPARTMKEFIDYARQNPGKLTYGTAGIGTAHHLYGEVLNKVAGIQMLNVPYRGVTPAFNDLLGGHVPVAIVSLATTLQHIQSGKVRLLTVFDTKRYPKAPEVPTITEVLPNYVPGRAWVGFLGPPALPAAITTRLNSEIVRSLKSPDVLDILNENGLDVIANTPSEFAVMIREDSRIWDEAAATAGLLQAQ
jgi:tripartite-type tricarboxylate transporter receptor subunit TctC